MAEVKTYEVDISTKQAQENVNELNKSLEAQVDLIGDLENEVNGYEKELKGLNDASSKTLKRKDKLNKQLREAKTRLSDEKKGLQDVTKERNKANQVLKEATDNQAEYSGVLGLVDNQLGGAIGKITGMTKAVGGATKGFKLMRVAIIGTGIGALVIALTSLGAAFTASEEGQNKFTKMMNTISVVTGNVVDILANLGEGIFAIGKAMVKLATGDLAGASAAWGEMKENINEVTEGIKNFGEETRKEIGIMNELSDARAYADKLERKLIVERAEADRERADLLEKAVDKEKYNLQERIAFLQEAGKLEEDITNKEIEAARIRFETKQQENKLSKSTKEDLNEEAELKAQLIQLETAKLRKAKLVTTQISALRKEERAKEKALQDEADRIEAEKEKEKDRLESEAKKLKDEEEKKANEERLRKLEEDALEEIRIAKLVVETKKQLQQQNLDNISSGFQLLGQLAGESKALQATAMIGEAAVSVAKTIISTQSANAAITAQGLALAIPTGGTSVATAAALVTSNNISAGISIASQVAATAQALSSLGKGGSPKRPSIGNTPTPTSPDIPESQAPAFNVVGASETNQLASAIGEQEQTPTRAYVVSSDVTSAQELDRNIVEGASIG